MRLDAVATYAADKVAKLHELRMVIATTPDYEPDHEQLDHYWASLELLAARDVATPLVRRCASSSRRWRCFLLTRPPARDRAR